MVKSEIEITLLEPLTIATQKGVGNVMPTLDYIPGSTVRGALAQLWIEAKGEQGTDGKFRVKESDKDEFMRMFLADDVIYGNATPGQFHTRILPRTAVTCKNSKGFAGHDGVRNSLFRDTWFALSGQFEPVELLCGYNADGTDPLEPIEGYFRNNSIVPVEKRFVTRTRISDSFQTAEHGSLYTREALESGQVFTGTIVLGDQNDRAILDNLLSGVGHILHFGAARSRGNGRAQVELKTHFPRWSTDVGKRFARLQENFARRCPGCFWTVSLLSDTILTDQYLRNKTWLEMEDIALAVEMMGQKNDFNDADLSVIRHALSSFEFVRGWSKSKQVVGWQSVWGMPKFDDTAIGAGSVFLFYRNSPVSISTNNIKNVGKPEDELLFQAMSLLELYGIGERRNEGFGQIVFCDDFNIEEAHYG